MAEDVLWLRKWETEPGWGAPSLPPQPQSPSLARQVGLHADQDDLTALTLEHGEACLLVLQNPVGGCDVHSHNDLHVLTDEAGREGKQASRLYLHCGHCPHLLFAHILSCSGRGKGWGTTHTGQKGDGAYPRSFLSPLALVNSHTSFRTLLNSHHLQKAFSDSLTLPMGPLS